MSPINALYNSNLDPEYKKFIIDKLGLLEDLKKYNVEIDKLMSFFNPVQ